MNDEALKPGYEWAEVLVMVKTYPAPSTKHGETVCVAGARLDRLGGPEWIRLYPVPFRALDDSMHFKKYQVIRLPIAPRGSYDPRPESFVPDLDHIRVEGKPVPSTRQWQRRRDLVQPLMGQVTTCDLIRMNKAGTMADAIQSLGMVKPAEVRDVRVEKGEPWRANQLEKVKAFSQADLFNPDGFPELQPVPYQLLIDYKCSDGSCKGHRQHLIDWELGVMGLTWPDRYGKNTASVIEDKFREMLDTRTHDVYLFIGNQHQRRATFSVCGIWSPKVG